jgi:TP901-1 family phage major tail protein
MKKPISGKSIIYLLQIPGEETLLPAYQTEGSWNREKELIDEQTKSGRVVGSGVNSETIELTFYAGQDDEGQEAIERAYDEDLEVKIWRVDTNLNATSKHNARFAMAIIESLEMSDPTEGFVEGSVSFPVLGKSVKGELDPLPAGLIEAASAYAFEQAFPTAP